MNKDLVNESYRNSIKRSIRKYFLNIGPKNCEELRKRGSGSVVPTSRHYDINFTFAQNTTWSLPKSRVPLVITLGQMKKAVCMHRVF